MENSRKQTKDSIFAVTARVWLTKEGIGEPVPLAAVLSDEPPPVQTRSKTEGSPEKTNEDVAQADVQQDEIDGRPEGAKLRENEQSQEVVEDTRH